MNMNDKIPKIAIISIHHCESSLCLAKYLAKKGCKIDYYFLAGWYHSVDHSSAFEYDKANRFWGIHRLQKKEAPEIYEYMEGLPVRMYLMRIFHLILYPRINKILLWFQLMQIKLKKYDAINIIGQSSWVSFIHDMLKNENLIHSFHEIGNHDGQLIPLDIVKKAILDNNKVILHSINTYNRYCSLQGVDVKRTIMVHFGKFETYKMYQRDVKIKLPFDRTKPIFLFFGFFQPYKGLDILVEALNLLHDISERFNVVVAGSGESPSLDYFRRKKNCYLINKMLENGELVQLIRMSNIVVLPYKSASQTGIIPTCMQFGKPVIATSVGAFTETVQNGYNGLLVEANNPKAFSDAMREFLSDSSLRQSLSYGASQFGVNDCYDWNNIAKQTLDFYLT